LLIVYRYKFFASLIYYPEILAEKTTGEQRGLAAVIGKKIASLGYFGAVF